MEQDNIYFNTSNGTSNTAVQQGTAESNSATLLQQTFAISKYKNECDNHPQGVSLAWDEFCLAFAIHQDRKTKAGGQCWSPVAYEPGVTRGNKNVIEITMAVIDVDSGVPVEQVLKRIDGYTYLIHSSYSHTQEKPKYRVIMPLLTPVGAGDWPDSWQRINSWLGEVNDPATKDASRLYYMPACPRGATDKFVIQENGKLLNVAELPELMVEVVRDFDAQKPRVASYLHIDGIEPLPQDALGSVQQLNEMQAKCSFIQWATAPANQPDVSEPLWGAMISNQCRFEGGNEAIHEGSSNHPRYDEDATDSKIERCFTGSAPITCKRIQELGFKGCPAGGCKLPSDVITRAPAGLGVWANKKVIAASDSMDAAISIEPSSMPKHLARYLNKYHAAGLVFVGGSFFGYREGYWPRLDEQSDMRKSIVNFLGEKANPKDTGELLTLCKDFQSASEQEISPDSSLICLANGTLDVKNGELLAFNPAHHLSSKTDIHWEPTASCERWLHFLDEIFVDDIDKAEKIQFLKMWFGYCLTPDVKQHKFVWMIGAGGNGKGVLLAILSKLVGPKNVSHAYLERLGDTFVRAELQNKLVNISAEMSAESSIADGYLKSIVAGDEIEAERKYCPSFSFRPCVKLIAATNALPRLLDLSDGFFRRAIILSFNHQFTGDAIDSNLENKLSAELPGILQWAVQGLMELRNHGSFIIPQSSNAALAKYRTESDPVKLFADECLEPTDKSGIMPSKVYDNYREWCRKNGFQPMSIITFGKGLNRLGFIKHRSAGKDYWQVKPTADNDFIWSDPVSLAVSLAEKVASEKAQAAIDYQEKHNIKM